MEEVSCMTDKQADTNRNDLIDLIIEKAQRIITSPDELKKLTDELTALKH